jgi:hypothetical protein
MLGLPFCASMLHAMIWDAIGEHLHFGVSALSTGQSKSHRPSRVKCVDDVHNAIRYFSRRRVSAEDDYVRPKDVAYQDGSIIMTPSIFVEAGQELSRFECAACTSSLTRCDTTSAEDCCQHIADIVACNVGVSVDCKLLHDLLAPVIAIYGPSDFLAHACCRSDIMFECIGESLAHQLRIATHTEFWGRPPPSNEGATQTILAELVRTRQALTQMRHTVLSASENRVEISTELVGDSLILRTGHANKTAGSVVEL